ncbi:peptide MFS transporter [Gluconacetobacter asukensis]|uniref:MFS transporter n=1 Tax=Gluconacetobacter asukensis TaxID=1017181 RepID=A0A7W4J2Q8_9PROT|nr:oligopeptide:H+ symporter [Gluconacetobacter asukensis]MBB2173613.1 MFS transporter [Gluconacetobacter asukensis]
MPVVSRAPDMPSRGRSFGVILAIELWERFGFYGTQAILLLYMVQRLRLSDADAMLLIGAFSALTYMLPVLGGLAGDRLIGARRCMVAGAALLALGYLCLGFVDRDHTLLILAMALISTGNGLFKPNAGNIVRQIYEGDDAELDAAFTIYYMFVNIGSSVAMLLCPWLQDRFGPSVAFFVCAAGLGVGLGYYMLRSDWLARRDGPLDGAPADRRAAAIVAAGTVLCLISSVAVLGDGRLALDGVWAAGGLIVLAWIWLYRRVERGERAGLRIAYLLCAETMLYALFYQQQATSLTLFALRAVDGDFHLGGRVLFHLSAGQFQALDPLWIFAASPFLAWIYRVLAGRGRDLSLAWKIVVGLGLGMVAFMIWWLCAAQAQARVSGWVMVVAYGFASVAELLTMGLGLAIIARYVPARLSGFMMGSLYLLWALAFYAGSVLSAIGGQPGAMVGAAAYVPLLRDLALLIAAAFTGAVALLPVLGHWEKQFARDRFPHMDAS